MGRGDARLTADDHIQMYWYNVNHKAKANPISYTHLSFLNSLSRAVELKAFPLIGCRVLARYLFYTLRSFMKGAVVDNEVKGVSSQGIKAVQ